MNRLAKLKQWLTPTEAAHQLMVTFKAPCSAAEVLRLGLDQRLVLSVRFMSPVRLVQHNSAASAVAPEVPAPQTQAGERRISTPTEIWDLPLVGSERASVEERCELLAGRRHLGARPFLPAYVKSRDGALWRLPSPGLPSDSEIVVRTDELAALEASHGAPPDAQEADLRTREKNTLLTVIAAVCTLDKIDLAEHGSQKKIIAAGQRLGLKLTAPTISRIVKEVREAVEDRKSKPGKF